MQDRGSVQARLQALLEHIRETNEHFLGYPCNTDFNYDELTPFLHYHINNIGDPFVDSNYRCNTREQEREVLDYFAGLYHLPKGDEWGYVTSGGTEGNMCGLFLARETYPKGTLYFSEESHYSIFKIAKVLRMEYVVIRTEDDGTMDMEDLDQKIRERPNSPVIVNVNIGTTMKGAIDSIDDIVSVIKKNNIANVYLHCDAALFGMILPFIKNAPALSFNQPISSIAISGHKFIGSPIPCGILLARKVCADRIAHPVEYVHSMDTTISGSRSGYGALLLWYAIEKRRHQFALEAQNCLDRAEWLMQVFQKAGIPCFKNPFSPIVVFKRPSDKLIQKWEIAVQRDWAHIIIMQHTSIEKLQKFLEELFIEQKIPLHPLQSAVS
ncbi:histidine decarboxylase [Candidatus Peregrinibacteria bacterium CG22_combo_CG10-13_8_21_14_all_49_11]|nr:MAG: histidine decarboxylase [Candidatus Peregrinibacteria bacterium CG22_combo_CG10-13_8_21_14_all_49_11]